MSWIEPSTSGAQFLYEHGVRIRREHAFLVPAGARLPFAPRGPVFRLR